MELKKEQKNETAKAIHDNQHSCVLKRELIVWIFFKLLVQLNVTQFIKILIYSCIPAIHLFIRVWSSSASEYESTIVLVRVTIESNYEHKGLWFD